jgi:hypothetical protein
MDSINFTTVSFTFGILLFLVSIIIMVSPLRERLTVIQSIQGFGVNLQITVLTLLILISAGLLSSGIWLQLRNIGGELESLRKEKEESEKKAKDFQQRYEDSTTRKAKFLLSLEGVNSGNRPDKDSLTCTYDTGSADETRAEIISASSIGTHTLMINTQDLQENATIKKIILTDKDTKKRWESKGGEFQPFQLKVEMEQK